nr:uncharacterized protein LOC126054008 [Helicoverpa armigera]
MNCVVCDSKAEEGEWIKCNGCKVIYHYKCANIGSTAIRRKQAQRSFKCDSCSKITHRVRVTDDTPVRGACPVLTPSLVSEEDTSDLLTSDEIINKVNGVILAKICDFEMNIIKEIKDTVAVLVMENSKLRQELKEANMKCNSYEQQIKSLEMERLREKYENKETNCEKVVPPLVLAPGTTPQEKSISLLASSSNSKSVTGERERESGREAPLSGLQPAAASYAAVAKKPADKNTVDVSGDEWTEVKRHRRSNPIIRGNSSVTCLKAVERKRYLHVWRLDKGTTEDHLKDYIKQVLENDSEIEVDKLQPKNERDYASFRVGVAWSNYDKLCDPEVWPINVEFSEWIWFRHSTKPSTFQTE